MCNQCDSAIMQCCHTRVSGTSSVSDFRYVQIFLSAGREAVDDLHTVAQLMRRRRPQLVRILYGLANNLNIMPVVEE